MSLFPFVERIRFRRFEHTFRQNRWRSRLVRPSRILPNGDPENGPNDEGKRCSPMLLKSLLIKHRSQIRYRVGIEQDKMTSAMEIDPFLNIAARNGIRDYFYDILNVSITFAPRCLALFRSQGQKRVLSIQIQKSFQKPI